MLQLVRVIDELPEAFDALLADARAEGIRNMSLLAEEWSNGTERFDGPTAALFAAFYDGELAGVGGMTPEKAETAMRMRRLYVRPQFRRSGVGRTLASAMVQQGLENTDALTVNARASEAAGPFWEAMGFRPVDAPGYTHRLER